MTLEALSELQPGEALAVLANDGKAVESLMHLAEEHHVKFEREDEGDYAVVTLTPTEKVEVESPVVEAVELMSITPATEPVLVFGSDSVGRGDDELGRILANEFVIDLSYQEEIPSAIVLYNSGVKLALEGSITAPELQALVDQGCQVYVDSVSFERYGSVQGLAVGELTDPYLIVFLLTSQPGIVSL